MSKDWFQVDREGLAKLLARKGLEFVMFELIQNGWDTGANRMACRTASGNQSGNQSRILSGAIEELISSTKTPIGSSQDRVRIAFGSRLGRVAGAA